MEKPRRDDTMMDMGGRVKECVKLISFVGLFGYGRLNGDRRVSRYVGSYACLRGYADVEYYRDFPRMVFICYITVSFARDEESHATDRHARVAHADPSCAALYSYETIRRGSIHICL